MRGDCTPGLNEGQQTRGMMRRLPPINTDWDPQQVYRQAVVLISFADKDFSMENPRETYDSIFNYRGFNKGAGLGCVADYFRDQSGGLLNLQFDVFGPYKVSQNAKKDANADSNTREYGRDAMTEATKMWLAEDSTRSYRDYDWNNDTYVNQVIFIYAGYTGNQSKEHCYGCIWPNTSSFYRIKTPDGFSISDYTCSGELRSNDKSWGIGTICHEFTHSLGLPDIYPTSSNSGYSMVDEWDLMDGGNFTNSGWCPPNYSGQQRMLMGWQTPIELTEPTTITDMKPLSEGGPVYLVRHTDNEYYLLENRQWTGWDARLPGRGLVVFHVDYNASQWMGNRVNNDTTRRGYQLVHADNLDYDAWVALYTGGGKLKYTSGHNPFLSTSAYPWSTDSTDFVNDHLTDSSMPASLMYNKNEAGSDYLSKAITNIRVSDDGLVSFDFMKEELDAVSTPSLTAQPTRVYNLRGYCVGSRLESQRPGIYIIRYADGTTKKVVKR